MENKIKKKVNDMPLLERANSVSLFMPFVPENAKDKIIETLSTRWIGQGPNVDLFERKFSSQFTDERPCIAVGSGTDALHLSYILTEVGKGDEVIVPLFTCTATNIPLLYQGAKIRFADIDPDTMNISVNHVRELCNERTKLIVCVHYGGLPCEMDELNAIANQYNIPIVQDAAQALGAEYKGKPIAHLTDYTIYSFQAIKHITTGDGGLLVLPKNDNLTKKAKRLRWFGIDREAKQRGVWENDIWEVGYKYQMTDIGATLGLAGLEQFEQNLSHRQKLFECYCQNLDNIPGLKPIGKGFEDRLHAAWLFTVIAENRYNLQVKLRENNIESNQVHYRNDRYSIFKEHIIPSSYPNMDAIEDKYLTLPLHHKVSLEDVERICSFIKSGW